MELGGHALRVRSFCNLNMELWPSRTFAIYQREKSAMRRVSVFQRSFEAPTVDRRITRLYACRGCGCQSVWEPELDNAAAHR